MSFQRWSPQKDNRPSKNTKTFQGHTQKILGGPLAHPGKPSSPPTPPMPSRASSISQAWGGWPITVHCETNRLWFMYKISVEGVCRKRAAHKVHQEESKKRRWRKWGFTWGGIWKPHKSSQFFAHVLTLIKVLQTTVSHCVCQTASYNKTRKYMAFGRVIPSIREFYLHANMNSALKTLNYHCRKQCF